MNTANEIKKVESLILQAKAIRDGMTKASENTLKILAACDKLGVFKIGIGEKDDTFKDSKGYSFNYSGSIFVDGNSQSKWPMAWSVAGQSGFGSGCGNSGQHQVSGQFIDGIYICKNGVWEKQ